MSSVGTIGTERKISYLSYESETKEKAQALDEAHFREAINIANLVQSVKQNRSQTPTPTVKRPTSPTLEDWQKHNAKFGERVEKHLRDVPKKRPQSAIGQFKRFAKQIAKS